MSHCILTRFLLSEPEDRPTASELLQHPFVQADPTYDFKASLKLQKKKEDTVDRVGF